MEMVKRLIRVLVILDKMVSNLRIYFEDELKEEVKGGYFLIIAENSLKTEKKQRPYEVYISFKDGLERQLKHLEGLASKRPVRAYVGVDVDVVSEISSDISNLVDGRISDCKRIKSFDYLPESADVRLVKSL